MRVGGSGECVVEVKCEGEERSGSVSWGVSGGELKVCRVWMCER